MSDDKSMHEIDLELICEYYSALTRQGPGSPEITSRAFDFIDGLNADSRVVDIGCGTGGQTMTLAKRFPGSITGVDLFPRFIELFTANAKELGVSDRVTGCVASMESLPFEAGELDLIWSEGAIYNIGFERGLREWRQYLKQGGYIAVSEISWFMDKRPAELDAYWMRAYPQIDTIPAKLAQLQAAGYRPVACFALPESCWLEDYYAPQAIAQQAFLAKYPEDAAVNAFIEEQRHEQRLYEKYKSYYGYAFYVGRKL